jgi:DNA polymerase-3 subunit alpha
MRPAGEDDSQRLKMSLEKALKQSPNLKEAYRQEEVTRELSTRHSFSKTSSRNASVHAAGVVISDQPLVNLLPLKQDEDGTIVTQYRDESRWRPRPAEDGLSSV